MWDKRRPIDIERALLKGHPGTDSVSPFPAVSASGPAGVWAKPGTQLVPAASMELNLSQTRFQRMRRPNATLIGFFALVVGCVGSVYSEFAQSPKGHDAFIQFAAVAPQSPNMESHKGVAFLDEWIQLAAQVSQRKTVATPASPEVTPASIPVPPEVPVRKSRRELRREARLQAREIERETRNALSREWQRGVVFVCIDDRCRRKRVVRVPAEGDREKSDRSAYNYGGPIQRRIFAPFQRF